jgi:hypothetical protein
MAEGLGLLENRPLTDSPEKPSSLSALGVSNESSLEDEWAVNLQVNHFSFRDPNPQLRTIFNPSIPQFFLVVSPNLC